MAVSFKVPASPKRNISASDTFIGVDLTNTAVDMEGTRSPNAENMVRHVPGKVRKRMGYYKEVLFGKKTNVNFADGTSSNAQQVFINVNNVSQWIKIYDLITKLPLNVNPDDPVYIYTLYIEFDYKAEADFKIINNNITVTASDDWTHFSGTMQDSSAYQISQIDIKSDAEQEIYIKNCSIMLDMDESYKWSPAPKYFVECENNEPIYGCHFLKNGKDPFVGDRVVNVNRALNTSDEYETVSGISRLIQLPLAEIPGDGVKVYVDFDYILERSYLIMYLCDDPEYNNLAVERGRIYSAANHASFSCTVYHHGDESYVSPQFPYLYFYWEYNTAPPTLQIKNLTVVYEKDDDYEWSPAPEDSNKKFHLKDLYSINPNDYALMNNISEEISGSNISTSHSFIIGSDEEKIKKRAYLSFDIQVSATKASSVGLTFNPSSGTGIFYRTYITIGAGDVIKKHYDYFYELPDDAEYYFKTLQIDYSSSASSNKIQLYIKDLKIQSYTVRDSYYVSPEWYLYHVGDEMYLNAPGSKDFKKVLEGANRHISRSWQLNNKCYIIDGKDIYYFSIEDGEIVESIGQDNAYIPLVTFAKSPSGGGTSRDAINLLQPGFYEQFIGESGVTEYQLSFSGLDETPCRAWVLNSSGNWVPKTEGTDFTVNRGTGKITFNTAPGTPPVTGEDNVKILAYRTIDDYRDRVTKCTIGTLFGVGGASDRIFLSGNPDHPNWDFYSQQYDPTYFPDLGYSVLGSEQSRIMGYAIVNNYLTTFKDGFETAQSVFVREGDLLKTGEEEKETSEPVFKLINTLQGEGVLAPYTFGYLQTEPLFLTKAGVFAITEQDITGEKYTQNRSFYLDGTLRKEPNLSDAIATVYDNQYILAVNNQLFVLDGLQATRTDKSEPYATRQYAGFYCTNVPATYIWADDALCFGTADGRVCRFYTDEKAPDSYNDDGKAIYACWETPDLDGQLFYKNKTFRYFAVRLMKAVKTSVKMLSEKSGIWTLIKEDVAVGKAPDFENWDFETFSFSCDESERLLHSKVRVKKVDKARFRVENDKVNEPFGLSDLALEYIESGNYKG